MGGCPRLRATSYDLRFVVGPEITEAHWDTATIVTGVTDPRLPLRIERHTVEGLPWETQYAFAIKASDRWNSSSTGLSTVSTGAARKSFRGGEAVWDEGPDGILSLHRFRGDVIIGGDTGHNILREGVHSGEWRSLGGTSGPVDALMTYDGCLYVGGRFDAADGWPSAHIARFDE